MWISNMRYLQQYALRVTDMIALMGVVTKVLVIDNEPT